MAQLTGRTPHGAPIGTCSPVGRTVGRPVGRLPSGRSERRVPAPTEAGVRYPHDLTRAPLDHLPS